MDYHFNISPITRTAPYLSHCFAWQWNSVYHSVTFSISFSEIQCIIQWNSVYHSLYYSVKFSISFSEIQYIISFSEIQYMQQVGMSSQLHPTAPWAHLENTYLSSPALSHKASSEHHSIAWSHWKAKITASIFLQLSSVQDWEHFGTQFGFPLRSLLFSELLMWNVQTLLKLKDLKAYWDN